MGLLIPEVFIIQITDAAFFILLLSVSPAAVSILRGWDFTSASQRQYRLEKKRHLVSAAVRLIFIFKIPLFLFYIYANDKLSNVLTGAMCAAGSINATVFGAPLLYVKIALLFLMTFWMTVNRVSSKSEELPHTRALYGFLLVITALSGAETLLSFANFTSMDTSAVVSCCSSIYSGADSSPLMSLSPFTAFGIFAAVSALLIVSVLLKKTGWTALFSILFFFSGVLNLILFTGTYVYELPSHKCPYCILQREYLYTGYLFYISLFTGSAAGVNSFIYNKLSGREDAGYLRLCFWAAIIYSALSIFYPIRYYLINNVWL